MYPQQEFQRHVQIRPTSFRLEEQDFADDAQHVAAAFAQRVELFLANEVNRVVGRYAEQPGAKREILFEPMEAAEGLGEGFNGEVLGIVYIPYHLEDHVVDWPLVALQQSRIGLVVAAYRHVNELEILQRLRRKAAF